MVSHSQLYNRKMDREHVSGSGIANWLPDILIFEITTKQAELFKPSKICYNVPGSLE